MSKNFLSANQHLHKGDFLVSNNEQWKAIFQEDGNFVIYGWKPTWASDTYGSGGFHLCMKCDGNLVIYNDTGKPKWDIGTWRDKKDNTFRLTLTDDGKLVINKGSEEFWSSAKSKGEKH